MGFLGQDTFLPAVPDGLRAQGIALRREEEADLPFLKALYASTREEEMARLALIWDEGQKQAFLEQQFMAQRLHYQTQIEDCRFAVIERENEPVGRLYLQERQTQLQIVDIALMPVLRRQGVGSALLSALIDAAGRVGKGVGLFVEPDNPAIRLYRRLGFDGIVQTGFYLEMERPFEAMAVS